MISNKNLIKAFFNADTCKYVHNGSMSCNHDKLYSYHTCIAQKISPNEVIINATKYSVTTSKQQTYTSCGAIESDYKVYYTNVNVPMGANNLTPYIKK